MELYDCIAVSSCLRGAFSFTQNQLLQYVVPLPLDRGPGSVHFPGSAALFLDNFGREGACGVLSPAQGAWQPHLVVIQVSDASESWRKKNAVVCAAKVQPVLVANAPGQLKPCVLGSHPVPVSAHLRAPSQTGSGLRVAVSSIKAGVSIQK